MRKLSLLPVAAIAIAGGVLSMQSCGKIVKKLHYDLPLQTGSVEVVVPPTSDTTTTHQVGAGTNTINIDSFIKANTGNVLGVKNITSVKITSVKITLLNGTVTNNFANFKSCYGSFYTNGKTDPYKLSIDNNPDVPAYELSLPVNANDDLKPYLNGNTFNYSVGGKLRRPITDSVRAKVEYSFNVTVNG